MICGVDIFPCLSKVGEVGKCCYLWESVKLLIYVFKDRAS